jgi:hypothetical protein
MLNPDFELSDERIMEELFPEIKNPTEELARVRAGKARKHPIFAHISLAEALKQEAKLLRDARDTRGAELYEKAAERLEAEITATQEQQPAQRPRVPIRPEALPPQEARQLRQYAEVPEER